MNLSMFLQGIPPRIPLEIAPKNIQEFLKGFLHEFFQ